jgi:TrkA domain protein
MQPTSSAQGAARPQDAITEEDLPGIGRRYQLRDAGGRTVTAVVHHSGRRDVYAGADGREFVTFTDDQARRFGAILSGVYFKPAAAARMEAIIGDLLIDWVTVHDNSPGAHRSIGELGVRQQTRMTIAAIVRAEVTIVAPEPTEVMQPGDQLVVIGRPDDLPRFLAAVVG